MHLLLAWHVQVCIYLLWEHIRYQKLISKHFQGTIICKVVDTRSCPLWGHHFAINWLFCMQLPRVVLHQLHEMLLNISSLSPWRYQDWLCVAPLPLLAERQSMHVQWARYHLSEFCVQQAPCANGMSVNSNLHQQSSSSGNDQMHWQAANTFTWLTLPEGPSRILDKCPVMSKQTLLIAYVTSLKVCLEKAHCM